MTLHRIIKHNEKVCRAHDLGSDTQGQGRSQVRGQNLVSAIILTCYWKIKVLKRIFTITLYEKSAPNVIRRFSLRRVKNVCKQLRYGKTGAKQNTSSLKW